MLKGTVLDQSSFGDVLVVLGQTHDEAKADLGVGIEFAGAEFEDVAHAFGGAVLAVDTVVGGRLANVGEGEVDFIGDSLHGGEDEFAEGILCSLVNAILLHNRFRAHPSVGTFADDMRLERNKLLHCVRLL